MLKGRLGIDEARIPQKSRNGLVYVERCRVAIDNGSMILAFDEAEEQLELPYQRLNALLLGTCRGTAPASPSSAPTAPASTPRRRSSSTTPRSPASRPPTGPARPPG